MPALKIFKTGLDQYAPGGNARVKVLIIGGPGTGKAAAFNTPVATPSGWTAIGELRVGDLVIGSDGTPTEVQGVFPQGVRPAFRVTLNDGTSVLADAEHLWAVQTRKERENHRTSYCATTTQQMIDAGVRKPRPGHKARYKYFLPLVAPVQHDKVELPIEPYLLGTLLANGFFSSDVVTITTNDEQVIARCIAASPERSFAEHTYATSTCRHWAVHKLHPELAELGLDKLKSAEKFVPSQYLVAHEQARRELLAGLLDGDGSTSANRRAAFSSTSPHLAQAVVTLVQSLGGVASQLARPRTRPDGAEYVEYTVKLWTPDNPFLVERKAAGYAARPWFRAIESIEPAGEAEMVCIKVAADDELYVVQDYIVTHNTRWSSYFPKPLYLDCEGGLASVADRQVAFTSIRNSQDMLDALNYLKSECPPSRPLESRPFQTVVVDTLDAFQRKVKDEWLAAHPMETSFGGFEAWNYLDAKMQMLSTRLLNLDMNIIVAVHYTSKTISEEVGGSKIEREQLTLQLQGAFKDQVFNDFDLIGWMGTYFEFDKEANSRVQKRGVTFKPSAEKPFLKDRLHVTPDWMEVRFSEEDYAELFGAVIGRLDDFEESQEYGEIPSGTGVGADLGLQRPPVLREGGPVPQQPAGLEIPLSQHDKPTLMKMARERGLDFRGNTLKAELVAMIQNHDAAAKAPAAPADAPATQASADAEPPAPQAEQQPTGTPAQPSAEATGDASDASSPEDAGDLAKATLAAYKASAAGAVQSEHTPAVLTEAAGPTVQTPDAGEVNPRTGEVITTAPPTHDEAVGAAVQQLGGRVVSDTGPVDDRPMGRPVPDNDEDGCQGTCMEITCTEPIGPTNSVITLSFMRTTRHLCADHYQVAKKSGKDSLTFKND